MDANTSPNPGTAGTERGNDGYASADLKRAGEYLNDTGTKLQHADAALADLRPVLAQLHQSSRALKHGYEQLVGRAKEFGQETARVPWLIAAVAATVAGYLGWQQYQTRQVINGIAERSEWQLENIIKLAFASGAKPEDSRECQGL